LIHELNALRADKTYRKRSTRNLDFLWLLGFGLLVRCLVRLDRLNQAQSIEVHHDEHETDRYYKQQEVGKFSLIHVFSALFCRIGNEPHLDTANDAARPGFPDRALCPARPRQGDYALSTSLLSIPHRKEH